jgi:hypothetical protein
MKSGPYLRVGEPVAVAAVFDGRLTVTMADERTDQPLPVHQRPQVCRASSSRIFDTPASPQSARQKSDSVSVVFLICGGSCCLSSNWLLSFQVSHKNGLHCKAPTFIALARVISESPRRLPFS